MKLQYLLPIALAIVNVNAAQTTVWMDHNGHFYWDKQPSAEDALVKQDRTALAQHLATTRSPLPLEPALAGGIGGNEKSGFIYYDGGTGNHHRPALTILRNPLQKQCYLQNTQVEIRDWKTNLDVVSFPCAEKNANGIYWQNQLDFTNGAYNPALDAFYYANAMNNFLERVSSTPAWQYYNGPKKPLIILLHGKSTYFDYGGFFSDGTAPWFINLNAGDDKNYPSTTLDALSNLIGVGYAMCHWGYSWGVGNSPSIAQSYTDFLTKSFEDDLTGTVNWSMGADTSKQQTVWRYLDKPARDCWNPLLIPGESCSIETYAQYQSHPYLKAEYGAGLLNKVLYTIATAPGWDMKSTLSLLNHATYYWGIGDWTFDPRDPNQTPPPPNRLNFRDVLCNLITAAQDLQSNATQIESVRAAIQQTGLDLALCQVTH